MFERRLYAFVVGFGLIALVAFSLQAVTGGPSFARAAAQDVAAPGDDDTGGAEAAPAAGQPATAAPSTEVTQKQMTPAEVRQLEDRLNALKEQVFESRAKLKQLRDQLVLGAASASNIGIYHTQDTSGVFRLLTLQYQLDGFDLVQEVNTDGHLNTAKKMKVFEGSLLPGDHLLVVDCTYQGRGFGLFSYLNNYAFHMRSRYSFAVEEGQAFNLQVTATDQGEALESIKDRLKVKFVKEKRNE